MLKRVQSPPEVPRPESARSLGMRDRLAVFPAVILVERMVCTSSCHACSTVDRVCKCHSRWQPGRRRILQNRSQTNSCIRLGDPPDIDRITMYDPAKKGFTRWRHHKLHRRRTMTDLDYCRLLRR